MTLDELRAMASDGRIDTVVIAMCDMQGRLMGKRLTAEHFLDEVVGHGAEGCSYLLAVDVDMNTVSGYAMSSWDRGYDDFVMAPDLDTLRPVPWLPGTALCMADVTWGDGTPVRFLGFPPQLSRTPASYRHAPPRTGEDTRAVLRDLLGRDESEIDRLFAAGSVG